MKNEEKKIKRLEELRQAGREFRKTGKAPLIMGNRKVRKQLEKLYKKEIQAQNRNRIRKRSQFENIN
jgi:hypothetical protein